MCISDNGTKWKRELLARIELIDTPEAARILDAGRRNGERMLTVALEAGQILGVRHDDGTNEWPAFQFSRRSGSIRPEVLQGNMLMKADRNPWAVLAWWIEPNEYLRDDAAPFDLLAADELTADEVEELIGNQFGG